MQNLAVTGGRDEARPSLRTFPGRDGLRAVRIGGVLQSQFFVKFVKFDPVRFNPIIEIVVRGTTLKSFYSTTLSSSYLYLTRLNPRRRHIKHSRYLRTEKPYSRNQRCND